MSSIGNHRPSKSKSILLSLSPEIRSSIWSHVFNCHLILLSEADDRLKNATEWNVFIALLLTCHQAQLECKPYIYNDIKVRIIDGWHDHNKTSNIPLSIQARVTSVERIIGPPWRDKCGRLVLNFKLNVEYMTNLTGVVIRYLFHYPLASGIDGDGNEKRLQIHVFLSSPNKKKLVRRSSRAEDDNVNGVNKAHVFTVEEDEDDGDAAAVAAAKMKQHGKSWTESLLLGTEVPHSPTIIIIDRSTGTVTAYAGPFVT